MTQLTLSLLQNAESFLGEALAKAVLAEKNVGEWKFAIFNLVQCIELALKERLRREHPLFVFGDVDNPKLSVSLERALSRLARIESTHLTEDDVKNIQLAATIRNSVTHHEVDVSVEQVRVVYATLFGFVVEFFRRQLQVEVSSSVSPSLWKEALAIDRHTSELCKRAEQQIKDEAIDIKRLLTCIKCWHDTYVDIPEIWRCYLCGFADRTTVCQECGLGMFHCEGHPAYYGKWRAYGKLDPEDWYPDLCDSCYEGFLENGGKPLRDCAE